MTFQAWNVNFKSLHTRVANAGPKQMITRKISETWRKNGRVLSSEPVDKIHESDLLNYFAVVVLIKAVHTSESVDLIVKSEYSNKSYQEARSCDNLCILSRTIENETLYF